MRSDRQVHQLLLVSVYQIGQTSSAVSVQPGLQRVSIHVACLCIVHVHAHSCVPVGTAAVTRRRAPRGQELAASTRNSPQ